MKKIFATLLLALLAFQGAALADVEGEVTSVDTTVQSLVVATAEGDAAVSYSETTTWPEGVTDPAALVGTSVKVTTDEAGLATAVEATA